MQTDTATTTPAASVTLLAGHVSPETAYVVADYPYGFRLRCQMRYWLDVHPRHGTRLMTQTSNPKVPGVVWNKPKASTFARFGGALFLDDAGHVQWSGLTEYTNGAEAQAWLAKFGEAVPPDGADLAHKWVAAKLAYDARRAAEQVSSQIAK